jgi:NAD(P)-dependent dehydrogenase (short-subunit alcohol dehydrogenase family)
MDLHGKTAVVTGGGGVLCSAMAEELAEVGMNVAVLDLKEEAAQAVAEKIREAGGNAIAAPCSVLERESLEAARDRVLAEFQSVHLLVNGAGGNSPKATTSMEQLSAEDLTANQEGLRTFFDLDAEGFKFVFDLNFLGTLLPTQVFARHMAGNGGGNVINISSMNAFRPLTKIPAYSAAKAAVSNFTQWLAVHLANVHIRVNAIAPGFFLTEQNKFLLIDEETGQLTPRGKTIISHTPMDRFGEPEDLLGTLLWLASDNSRFVTGIVVPVDGGFSAFSGV